MVIRTADEMHAVFISDARASGPSWLASRCLDLKCNTCLMDESIQTGFHVVWTAAAISPYMCLERNPKAWSKSESRLDGLLNHPNECMLEEFEASWHRGRSGRESTSSGRDDALVWCASRRYDTLSGGLMQWPAGCLDGMTCRPDGW